MKPKVLCMLVTGMILTGCLTGCGAGRNVFHAMEAASGTPDELKTNIVKVINHTGNGTRCGTGFFTEEGCLVTASNVVDTKGKITIQYIDGTSAAAELVSNNIQSNVAILSTETAESVQAMPVSERKPEDGETVYAIGYEAENGQPVVQELTCRKNAETEGISFLTATGDNGFVGGPVVDSEGKLIGVDMLDGTISEEALMLESDALKTDISAQMKKPKTENAPEGIRSNAYTQTLEEEQGIQGVDFYIPGQALYGQVTDGDGVCYWINQKNSPLVQVQYDAENAKADSYFGLHNPSEAIAKTDQGEYTIPMNRIQIKVGEKGTLLLYFKEMKGTIEQIKFTNVISDKEADMVLQIGRPETEE